MLDTIFKGLFDSATTAVISVPKFLICVGFSLLLGFMVALCYTYRTRYTRSFVVTLAVLPAVVCVVIMMVNGNIGAGVAVAGAFSLVRFRSAPGSAKEITALFLGMGAGLIAGMGYLAYAFLFTLVLCLAVMLYERIGFGGKRMEKYKTITVTIPEDLDYTAVFDDLFARFTKSHTLEKAKTTNMGSMYRLTYEVILKDPAEEKELIDQMRCRNGNLEIVVSRTAVSNGEL